MLLHNLLHSLLHTTPRNVPHCTPKPLNGQQDALQDNYSENFWLQLLAGTNKLRTLKALGLREMPAECLSPFYMS